MKLPHAKKLPSGNWRVQTFIAGEKISITRGSKTEAESIALALKLRQSNAPKDTRRVADLLTLSQAIDLYLEDTGGELSPSTVKSYRAIQKYRFKSAMDVPMSRDLNWQYLISEEKKCHIIKVYKGKEIVTDKTVSAKTIKNAWGLVGKVMKHFKLPVPDVTLSKVVIIEHEFLDPDDIKVFLELIEGHRYELPYLLCLHGLRRSEMIVVKKSDIFIKKSDGKYYIRVHGAAVYDEHNKLVEKKENKTVDSRREVPVFIPRLLTLVDAAPDGKLYTKSPNNLTRPLNTILKKNNLPEVGLHGLRHTFVSLCYHLQIPTLVTKKWGGYSKKSTVVETIYTHLSKKDEEQSLVKMQDFYREFT